MELNGHREGPFGSICTLSYTELLWSSFRANSYVFLAIVFHFVCHVVIYTSFHHQLDNDSARCGGVSVYRCNYSTFY